MNEKLLLNNRQLVFNIIIVKFLLGERNTG